MPDGLDERDPENNPAVCSKCGVALGTGKRISGSDYCDPCERDLGIKPPIRRCMHCGTRAPQEQMESIDVSGPEEYYPEIRYLCPGCASGDGGGPA